uniref:Uncharacterized protein n=1 Tax=Daphnia galeata TaxID=27404 RepID=A0A8J2RK11_9CRUS|nr:unnamed protein product [Daphnia galeata]
MSFAHSLFIFAVVSAIALTSTANDQELEGPEFYPYKNYFGPKQGGFRQEMMTLSLIIPVRPTRQTIMEWTTSTSKLVCTKYTDAPCSLRTSVIEMSTAERPPRRTARPGRPSTISTVARDESADIIVEEGKGIMIDEDFEGQFSIFPSIVQRVEPTRLPGFPIREARAADPQLMLMYRNRNQDIESGIESDPYKSIVMPINRRYSRPAINFQRQFLQNFWTVTSRSTIVELAVSTSTPVCSTTGPIPQCAINENFRCEKNV